MNFILNILWFVLGGIWMGLGWIIAGLIMIVTIIGIPWARSAFAIASFSFWPFGRMAVDRRSLIPVRRRLAIRPAGGSQPPFQVEQSFVGSAKLKRCH